jgi:hypothetical protein
MIDSRVMVATQNCTYLYRGDWAPDRIHFRGLDIVQPHRSDGRVSAEVSQRCTTRVENPKRRTNLGSKRDHTCQLFLGGYIQQLVYPGYNFASYPPMIMKGSSRNPSVSADCDFRSGRRRLDLRRRCGASHPRRVRPLPRCVLLLPTRVCIPLEKGREPVNSKRGQKKYALYFSSASMNPSRRSCLPRLSLEFMAFPVQYSPVYHHRFILSVLDAQNMTHVSGQRT